MTAKTCQNEPILFILYRYNDMPYISLNKANRHHKTRDANGQATSRYSRYETGIIEGGNRQLMAVIADSAGFDGMGFNAAIGSGDDHWHVASVFDSERRYIDTLVIGGAFDAMHARQVADSQLHHLGGDNCVIVVNPQFDSMTAGKPDTWSIDAIDKLLDNRSQDRGFLPVITAQELNVEAARVTFDSVQWDSMTGLVSHNGNDSALFIDMVRADGHKQLLTPLNLINELAALGAEEFTFDALMDKKLRLTLLTDRLFNAMSRAGDADLSVTGVTETKPFKRQGVTNIAYIFDLSDGQKLSIWFHNPDSTPAMLKPDDIMISWKWMLNKRDVTAVLSPKQGDNVQLPVLAARIMRVARKNSKRYQAAMKRAAVVAQELADAQSLVDSKQGEIEQLDTDIAGLNTQLDAAMAAQKEIPKDIPAPKSDKDTESQQRVLRAQFAEVTEFYKNNGEEPSLYANDIMDKVLAKRLEAIRANPEFVAYLAEFDTYNLLNDEEAPAIVSTAATVETVPYDFGDPIVWRSNGAELHGTFKAYNASNHSIAMDTDDGQMNAPADEVSIDHDANVPTAAPTTDFKVGDAIVWRNEFGEMKGTFRGLIGQNILIMTDDGQMSAAASEVFADTSAPAATTPAINEKKLTAMMEDINDFYENGKKLPDIASPSNNERVIAGWLAELKEADAPTMDFVRPLDVHGLLDGSFEASDDDTYTKDDVIDGKVYKTMGAAKANMTKNKLDKRRFEIVEIAGGGFGIKANPLDRDILRPQIFALIDEAVAAYPDPENVTMIANRSGFDLFGKIISLADARLEELERENIITKAEIKEAVYAHVQAAPAVADAPAVEPAPVVEPITTTDEEPIAEPAADVIPEKLNQVEALFELSKLAPKSGEAIKSDDPDAIEKLEAKLAYHQARAAMMRDANKNLRRGDDDALYAMGFKDKTIAALKEPDYAGRTGFVDYQMTNNNGEIGRIKKRLKALYKERDANAPVPVTADNISTYIADASTELGYITVTDNGDNQYSTNIKSLNLDSELSGDLAESKRFVFNYLENLGMDFSGLILSNGADVLGVTVNAPVADTAPASYPPVEYDAGLDDYIAFRDASKKDKWYAKHDNANGHWTVSADDEFTRGFGDDYPVIVNSAAEVVAKYPAFEGLIQLINANAQDRERAKFEAEQNKLAANNEFELNTADLKAYEKGIEDHSSSTTDSTLAQIAEAKAVLDDAGTTYLDESEYQTRINSGDMAGVSESKQKERLNSFQNDVKGLRNKTVKPSKIVGTGYTDGRSVAFSWLAGRITELKASLNSTPSGFEDSTNLRNYAGYLSRLLKDIGNDEPVNDDARAQTMDTINEFAKTHEGFNGFIGASDEAEAAIAGKPAGEWVVKIDDDQSTTIFMSLGNGQYTGAYNLTIELAYNDIFKKTKDAAARFGTVDELANVAGKRAGKEDLDDLFDTRMDGTGAASKRVLKGKTNKAKTAKGTSIASEFALVDAKFLIASHNATGTKNPKYPQDLQPRDRARESSIAWVQKTSKALDPESLGRTSRVDTGAPIVGDDLIVESGNGRTIAIKMAYKNGDAKAYREWLIENARMFGFTEQQVESYKQPVLVRMRTTEVNRAEFAVEANQDDKLSFTASERAKADSKRISGGMLELFAPAANGDINAASNRPFVKQFLASLGATEAAQYTDSNGYPTQALVARIKSAIFSKAYDDDRLLEMMADQTKPDLQNMLNALTMAAPSFVAAQAVNPSDAQDLASQVIDGVEKSINDEVKTAIVDATNMIMSANQNNQDVKEYVLQLGLFDDVDDATAELAVFLAANARSAKKMADYFNAMAKYIEQDAAKRLTLDIFDDPKPISMADVIAYANQTTTEVETPMTQDMFAEPAAAPVVEPVTTPAPASGELNNKVADFESTVKAADFNPADFDADAFIALVEAAANDVALTARIQAISAIYQQKLIAASMAAMTALAGGA